MSSDIEKIVKRPGWFGVGAVLTAIGASACCIGPLLLLSLGIGGAWVGALTSMEVVRPFFLIATLVFIGLAFRRLYLVPESCETGEACAKPSIKRNQRVFFGSGRCF